MVKRRIPVSNRQVNETKLINSLNSKLLKKENESIKALKKRYPGMEKTVDSFFVNVLEDKLAEAEELLCSVSIRNDGKNKTTVC